MLYKVLFSLFLFFSSTSFASETITIGSKRFTENYILGELLAQILEENGITVNRKFGLGGTMVAYDAIMTKQIDLYVDYTGTVTEAILKADQNDIRSINRGLNKMGLSILDPIGIDNTYCFIMRSDDAKKLNIKTIGDLGKHLELFGGLTAEFQGRKDGWIPVRKLYGLNHKTTSIEVPLSYEALKNKKLDFADAFSTDPLIKIYNFVILEDDKKFFPKYEAVPLIRNDLPENIKKLLNSLKGRIDNNTIMDIHSKVLEGATIASASNEYLYSIGLVSEKKQAQYRNKIIWPDLLQRTKDHIYLTFLAVIFATLIAVPLGTIIVSYKKASQFVLSFTGIMQTIPSIALLTFMIPFFGIGFKPALVGLFIYSLLPILRNTYVAMTTIDPRLIIAARGIGLYPHEILLSVKLPLAFPTILTGIRTATTLNIGTATLAAFIGAGGLGESIVTGLALNDTNLVLQGAIPAAVLAILVDFIFSLIDKTFTKNI